MIQKQKEEDQFASASQQEASQSGKSNTYLLLHSIRTIFKAWSKKESKEVHLRQHHSKNQSNRQSKYLQAAPFHSHIIYRAIQKQKEEDPFASASQQETSQSGKSNTYSLLHSIRTTITARFKNKKEDQSTSASQ